MTPKAIKNQGIHMRIEALVRQKVHSTRQIIPNVDYKNLKVFNKLSIDERSRIQDSGQLLCASKCWKVIESHLGLGIYSKKLWVFLEY